MLRDSNEENKIQLAIKQRVAKKKKKIARIERRDKIEHLKINYRSNPNIFFGRVNEIKKN